MEAVKLLTIDEVAAALRKSPAQIRWMKHRGDTGLKFGKIGGRVMVREADLVDYVNAAFEKEGASS